MEELQEKYENNEKLKTDKEIEKNRIKSIMIATAKIPFITRERFFI